MRLGWNEVNPYRFRELQNHQRATSMSRQYHRLNALYTEVLIKHGIYSKSLYYIPQPTSESLSVNTNFEEITRYESRPPIKWCDIIEGQTYVNYCYPKMTQMCRPGSPKFYLFVANTEKRFNRNRHITCDISSGTYLTRPLCIKS